MNDVHPIFTPRPFFHDRLVAALAKGTLNSEFHGQLPALLEGTFVVYTTVLDSDATARQSRPLVGRDGRVVLPFTTESTAIEDPASLVLIAELTPEIRLALEVAEFEDERNSIVIRWGWIRDLFWYAPSTDFGISIGFGGHVIVQADTPILQYSVAGAGRRRADFENDCAMKLGISCRAMLRQMAYIRRAPSLPLLVSPAHVASGSFRRLRQRHFLLGSNRRECRVLLGCPAKVNLGSHEAASWNHRGFKFEVRHELLVG